MGRNQGVDVCKSAESTCGEEKEKYNNKDFSDLVGLIDILQKIDVKLSTAKLNQYSMLNYGDSSPEMRTFFRCRKTVERLME